MSDTMELARRNMITQQLRTCGVLDEQILAVIESVPREDYVPEAYRTLAYADCRLPIGHDETMLMPLEEGRILQALRITPEDRVLEIGTGTGYFTALLAQMAKHVFSVDIVPEFVENAKALLAKQRIQNVSLYHADASQGFSEKAPYDVIVITGGLPRLPQAFQDNLKTGGRIVAILGDFPSMQAVCLTRVTETEWISDTLFDTMIKPLDNSETERFFL